MKLKNIKYTAVAALTALTMSSCDDFLDRPTEDSYNTDNFYVQLALVRLPAWFYQGW